MIYKHDDLIVAANGDIHGEFDILKNNIKKHDIKNACVFLCGDFGVGFRYNNPVNEKKEKRRLQEFNLFLKKRNIFLYVIRGNHDNPALFDGNHNFTNIIFMQDYDIVEVGEFTYLGIGGATTVDRKPNHNFKDLMGRNYPGRTENVDWWPGDEKIVYDEGRLNNIAGVDVVLTHTCPDFVYPPVLGGTVYKWCECDPDLKNELIAERELVTKIYNKLNELNVIKAWFYAHFHQTHWQIHNNTKFQLLDIGEFHEIDLRKKEE
jgi:hypothetical protein